MITIGFNFAKNDFRYAVLDGKSPLPIILDKGKIVYPSMDVPELMEWFETQLSLILDKNKPDIIAHKISLTLPSLDQIKYSCYPQAILNLISRKKNIKIQSFSSQGINATKFGLPKKSDVFAYLDTIIGKHPPHWDKPTKEAVLVAWFNLM
jgi:hypothetical protein